MKKVIFVAACVVCFGVVAAHAEKSRQSEWVPEPTKSVNTIIFEEKGEIISSEVDNAEHLIYLKTPTDFYRCDEIIQRGGKMKVLESFCQRLKKP